MEVSDYAALLSSATAHVHGMDFILSFNTSSDNYFEDFKLGSSSRIEEKDEAVFWRHVVEARPDLLDPVPSGLISTEVVRKRASLFVNLSPSEILELQEALQDEAVLIFKSVCEALNYTCNNIRPKIRPRRNRYSQGVIQ